MSISIALLRNSGMKFLLIGLLAAIALPLSKRGGQGFDSIYGPDLNNDQLTTLLKLSEERNARIRIVGSISNGVLIEDPVDYRRIPSTMFYCGLAHIVLVDLQGQAGDLTKAESDELDMLLRHRETRSVGRTGDIGE